MPDKKISELTELSSPADADELVIVDDSAGETKRITWSSLKTAIQSLIEGLASYFSLSSNTLDDIIDGATYVKSTNDYTDAEKSKLSGIATGADVTGANPPQAHTHTESEISDLDHDATKIQGVTVDDTAKADGKVLKYSGTSGNLEYADDNEGAGGGDADAIHDNVSGEIAAITEKTTPVDADVAVIEDSAASNAKKRLSWSNIKATLKTYFDTLYALSGHNHSGTYEPADATILKQADVDDTPVNGVTTAPVSSNWAYDHVAAADPHTGYCKESDIDDAPVNGETAAPISSNWAYDHAATDASDSAKGHVELATAAETTTGADTARAVTPDGLAGSDIFGAKTIQAYVFEAATDWATGDGKAYFVVPQALNGMNLVRVHARAITAGTTGTSDIQIRNVTDSQDMLSTKITIDSGETGSDTAATAAVINTSYDDVATNDLIAIDIDATATTKPKGLILTLEFKLP